jgi:predicted transcriptional regulator
MAKSPEEKRAARIARLRRLASRAYEARAKFEDALEKEKARPDWEQAADEAGIAAEADVGDWMC